MRPRVGLTFVVLLPLSLAILSCQNGSSVKQDPANSDPPGSSQSQTVEVDVLTYHYDATRQGLNALESTLTLSNVNTNTFGKIAFFPVDGKVDGQPLYVHSLVVSNLPHNTLFVVTENDSVYAFDADTGTKLWQASALADGEMPSDNHGCDRITPTIGITDTPVIDLQQGPNGAIYFVAMSEDSDGNYHQRLHALDLATGGELFGGPTEIQATYPGTGDNSQNGQVIFDPAQYAERAALLELNGVIYMAFTSHCDFRPYTGWLMGYSATTLAQTSVLNFTPNGAEGAIWMAGAGLAADSQGYIYLLDANGSFDSTLNSQGFPINGDFGNGFLKIATSPQLTVADYFEPYNTVSESGQDVDLGSGGAMILPDLSDSSGRTRHLVIGAGKDWHIYILDRDNMGKFNSNNNNAIFQDLTAGLPGGVWGGPAYFNDTIYYGNNLGPIRAFKLTNGQLPPLPGSQTTLLFAYPGAQPSVSANGTSNGIVWAVENTNPAVLHAYDAANLTHELYNSNQAGTRDQFGPGDKFITPVVANGKVFVGTTNGVAAFGLLQ
jgi:outer membrane protein assembly factor BamB